MARRTRLQFPGAFYHVVNRGDRDESIFGDDADRTRFIETLRDVCGRTAWRIHAFVLMPNHFHLLVQTPEPNLVTGMKWMLGTYTARFNSRHQGRGHLFAGRYRAQLVSPTQGFVEAVADYIHLNPARTRLVGPSTRLGRFPWSSLHQLLTWGTKIPEWLATDRVLPSHSSNIRAAALVLEERLEQLRNEKEQPQFDSIRSRWCFGDEEFQLSLLHELSSGARPNHFGKELSEAAEAKAEGIVISTLAELEWSENQLRARPKGDPQKIALAQRLRAETTVTMEWIANRLQMGARTYLAHLLYWERRGEKPPRTKRTQAPAPRGIPTRHLALAENAPTPQSVAAITHDGPEPNMFDPSFD